MSGQAYPTIEIVINRHYERDDEVQVFVDGTLVRPGEDGALPLIVVLVDPGRGWTRESWSAFKLATLSREMTPGCREACVAAFAAVVESEYIE